MPAAPHFAWTSYLLHGTQEANIRDAECSLLELSMFQERTVSLQEDEERTGRRREGALIRRRMFSRTGASPRRRKPYFFKQYGL